MISLVIPTMDCHESLQRTLRAVTTQTHKSAEVILVTGSTDSAELGAVALTEGEAVTIIESPGSVCVQRNR